MADMSCLDHCPPMPPLDLTKLIPIKRHDLLVRVLYAESCSPARLVYHLQWLLVSRHKNLIIHAAAI